MVVIGVSGGVMVCYLVWQTITREFESHWVAYASGLVQQQRILCK